MTAIPQDTFGSQPPVVRTPRFLRFCLSFARQKPVAAVSAVVLLMELTGRDRSFILPLLLMVGTATLVSRSIEPRSIYEARLSDEEVAARQALRDR